MICTELLNPVQMNIWTPEEVDREVRRLIDAAGARDKIAVCCINMDASVPDENVAQLFRVVEL